MKHKQKTTILRSIGIVCEVSGEEGLNQPTINKLENELKLISDYFSVTRMQAWLMAMIFGLRYKNSTVDVNDIASNCKSNPLRILELTDDINTLIERGYVKKVISNNPYRSSNNIDQMIPNKEIGEAIIGNRPLPADVNPLFDDITELLEKIYSIGVDRDNDELTTADLFNETSEILKANRHLMFIKRVQTFGLNMADSYFFLYMVWKTVSGNERILLQRACEGIYDRESARVKYIQGMIGGTNELIRQKLVEVIENSFLNETDVCLTSTAADLIEKCGLKIIRSEKRYDNILRPQKLASKKLFYNPEEEKQLELIRNMLKDDNIKNVFRRLKEKKMTEGITILLHGYPGTGKTETVYQMARASGRDIMKVDLSKTRSMWFGESEKLVKRIFTDYRDFSRSSKTCPILLFNEADGVISKRIENTGSGVEQTENTIQNIILEELENFSGIFFATTNLVKNLDIAFERRFLFKVAFAMPVLKNRAKIWKSRFRSLTIRECEILAGSYIFSGAQIENVARKCEMSYVLNNKLPGFEEINEFCRSEKLNDVNAKRIGYRL